MNNTTASQRRIRVPMAAITEHQLTGKQLILLMVLLDRADNESRRVTLNPEKIAARAGLVAKHLKLPVAALAEAGLVEYTAEASQGLRGVLVVPRADTFVQVPVGAVWGSTEGAPILSGAAVKTLVAMLAYSQFERGDKVAIGGYREAIAANANIGVRQYAKGLVELDEQTWMEVKMRWDFKKRRHVSQEATLRKIDWTLIEEWELPKKDTHTTEEQEVPKMDTHDSQKSARIKPKKVHSTTSTLSFKYSLPQSDDSADTETDAGLVQGGDLKEDNNKKLETPATTQCSAFQMLIQSAGHAQGLSQSIVTEIEEDLNNSFDRRASVNRISTRLTQLKMAGWTLVDVAQYLNISRKVAIINSSFIGWMLSMGLPSSSTPVGQMPRITDAQIRRAERAREDDIFGARRNNIEAGQDFSDLSDVDFF